MSTETLERPSVTIEDLPDLDASVPCEIKQRNTGVNCVNAATCRIRFRCHCGWHQGQGRAIFACRPCAERVAAGLGYCNFGGAVEYLGNV